MLRLANSKPKRPSPERAMVAGSGIVVVPHSLFELAGSLGDSLSVDFKVMYVIEWVAIVN